MGGGKCQPNMAIIIEIVTKTVFQGKYPLVLCLVFRFLTMALLLGR